MRDLLSCEIFVFKGVFCLSELQLFTVLFLWLFRFRMRLYFGLQVWVYLYIVLRRLFQYVIVSVVGYRAGVRWIVCFFWIVGVGFRVQVRGVIELSQRSKFVQLGLWSVLVLVFKKQILRWNEMGKRSWKRRRKQEQEQVGRVLDGVQG